MACLALGFVSGGVALGYEVLWTRAFLNLLGSTTTASAAILASFMAGISLGAWLAGRWTARHRQALWLFAAAESLLGVFGFSFPWIMGRVGDFLPGDASAVGVLSALVLGPTFLMGVALPALAAALQGYGFARPRHIAWLYGLNTLGGAVGAIGVGFGALPALGLNATGKATATAGLLAAGAAVALATYRKSGSPVAPDRGAKRKTRARPDHKTAIMIALVVGGIAALGYEVLWTRILVLVVGSSTNAFTLMIGLYLFGLGLGGIWIGHYLGRIERPVAAFQNLQLAVATSALAGVGLFGFLPGLALFGFARLGTSPWSIAVVNGAVAAVVIVPPTIFIGASLPVAARLMERDVARRGRELGTALALVTAGNVVGVLVTAFGVVPTVGLQHGVALMALLNLAAALGLWAVHPKGFNGRRFIVPGVALCVVFAAALVPPWDRAVMTSGVFRQAPVYLALLGGAERLARAFAAYRTIYYREGSEAVVAVFDRPTLEGRPHRVLTIDGKIDASTGSDMATQVLSGHLPFLFRPDAGNALVIGLASGVTVGALTRHPLERIDVVEIEPAVLRASRAFDDVSGSPLRDRRVRVTIGDGRRYLKTVSKRYDVIISEPSNPWLSMSSRLFTREFFDLVRTRLAPRGVLVQWIPLYGLSVAQFGALLRTLIAVFPNVSLFRVAEGDLVAVARAEPFSIRPEALDGLFEGASRNGLKSIGIRSPADLLALWVADARGLRRTLGSGPVNTDDNGLLEFGSPWYLLGNTIEGNLSIVDRAGNSSGFVQRMAEGWSAAAEGPELLQAVARRYLAAGRIAHVRQLSQALRSRGRIPAADLLLGDATGAEGRWSEADEIWRRHDTPAFRMRRARIAFKKGEVGDTVRLLRGIPVARRSDEDNLIHALALTASRREGEALDVLRKVREDANSAAGIIISFVRSALLADLGESRPARLAARSFENRMDGLRRCLETDRCHHVVDQLHAWGRVVPLGVSGPNWDRFRQTLYIRVTRPLPLFMRGVSALWLGDKARARSSLRTYLELLPEPDALSRAHGLLRPEDELPNRRLTGTK